MRKLLQERDEAESYSGATQEQVLELDNKSKQVKACQASNGVTPNIMVDITTTTPDYPR